MQTVTASGLNTSMLRNIFPLNAEQLQALKWKWSFLTSIYLMLLIPEIQNSKLWDCGFPRTIGPTWF